MHPTTFCKLALTITPHYTGVFNAVAACPTVPLLTRTRTDLLSPLVNDALDVIMTLCSIPTDFFTGFFYYGTHKVPVCAIIEPGDSRSLKGAFGNGSIMYKVSKNEGFGHFLTTLGAEQA